MKVLIWNVKKIGKVEKQREAKDYIRAQEADLIGLVETKVRSGKVARITRCLGKKNCCAAGNPSLYKFSDEVFEQNFDRREV